MTMRYAETYLIDLRQTNIPIYNPDDSSHNNKGWRKGLDGLIRLY